MSIRKLATHRPLYSITILVVMLGLHLVQRLEFLPVDIGANPIWICGQFTLFFLLFFPLKRFWLGGILWYLFYTTLKLINDKKWDFTKFFLTEMDIVTQFKDPFGLLNVAGVHQYLQLPIIILCLLLFVGLVWKNVQSYSKSHLLRSFHGVSLGFAALIVFSSYDSYGSYLYRNLSYFKDPRGELHDRSGARIEKKTGPLGFMGYSRHAIALDHKKILRSEAGSHRDPAVDLSSTVDPKKLPNILVVLSESTFQIDKAFDVSPAVENAMYTQGQNQFVGGLIVPTIGGGTWKSEFETITGLKTHLFGLRGEYPHQLLSQHVHWSFPKYLRQLGYSTNAYYPVKGTFYNARVAYKNYGFAHYSDAIDLGLTESWSRFSDFDMMKRVLKENTEDRPNFTYVVALENHGPHPCVNFKDDAQFSHRLSKTNDFKKNCEVNEYIRRQKSSEMAFKAALENLKKLEKNTGRPYILVYFGDHQPLTFSSEEYDSIRTAEPATKTFYTINYSSSLKAPKLNPMLLANALPTQISLFLGQFGAKPFLSENLKSLQGPLAEEFKYFAPIYSKFVWVD